MNKTLITLGIVAATALPAAAFARPVVAIGVDVGVPTYVPPAAVYPEPVYTPPAVVYSPGYVYGPGVYPGYHGYYGGHYGYHGYYGGRFYHR
jgi:hypothetical protein